MRNAGWCGGLRPESGRCGGLRSVSGRAAAFRGMPGAEKGKTRIRNRSKINIVHGACACYTNARKLLPYCVAAVIFPHCAAAKSEQPFKGEKEKKMKYTLYGDGLHDDQPAIQQMLDSGVCEVTLPPPQKCYVIGKTLKIHGGQCLRLPAFALIRLADGADCSMVEDDDFSAWKENICIEGGIWDMNHANQSPNPYHFAGKDGKKFFEKGAEVGWNPSESTVLPAIYTGFCMRFCRVRGLRVENIVLRNPVTYGMQVAYCEDFTFRAIRFDYTEGSPKLWNMDGIHIEGHCKNGLVSDLKGACHDDLVAITADDGLYGPIENIVVDGLFAEHCHSAVRLLSHGLPVKNVTIRNVFGSFYTYCVGLTKYHAGETRGVMKNICIENVSAAASKGTEDVWGGNFPFIWVEKGLDVEDLRISRVVREEKTYPTPMLKIDEGASVKGLWLSDLHQKSLLEGKIEQTMIGGEDCIYRNDMIQ